MPACLQTATITLIQYQIQNLNVKNEAFFFFLNLFSILLDLIKFVHVGPDETFTERILTPAALMSIVFTSCSGHFPQQREC